MPTMPIARRSLAEGFLIAPSWAARSCRAYQVGSPAAASVPSERWRKPRRERFQFPTFHPPLSQALDRGESSRRLVVEVLSAEELLGEVVEVVPPLGRVVSVAVDVPDVRDVLLFQVGMHALADAEELVLVAAGDPQELELLLRAFRVGNQFRGRLRVRGR